MKLTIETAENGFIVRYEAEEEPSSVAVFEKGEVELEALKSMYYYIRDMLGYNGCKHDKYRLYIEIAPGENHSDWSTILCPLCFRQPEPNTEETPT